MDLLFNGPPKIPKDLNEVILYKLQTKEYYNRLKSLVWIFIEIMATLLVLGIIWITIEWVKIIVSAIAIVLAAILLGIIYYIF